MGSFKEDKDLVYEEPSKVVKTSIACVCSFLISVTGGLVLVWWALQYHPSNGQQWMVPLGLLLLGTPIVVWFSLFASVFCKSVVKVLDPSRPIDVLEDSAHDPELAQVP